MKYLIIGLIASLSISAQSPKSVEAPREGVIPERQQTQAEKEEERRVRANWDREEEQAQREVDRRRAIDLERAKID